MSATVNFGLYYMTDGQAGAYLVINEALLNIDKAMKENRAIACTRAGEILFDRISGDVILDRFNPD
jgi:hypothetical protein